MLQCRSCVFFSRCFWAGFNCRSVCSFRTDYHLFLCQKQSIKIDKPGSGFDFLHLRTDPSICWCMYPHYCLQSWSHEWSWWCHMHLHCPWSISTQHPKEEQADIADQKVTIDGVFFAVHKQVLHQDKILWSWRILRFSKGYGMLS